MPRFISVNAVGIVEAILVDDGLTLSSDRLRLEGVNEHGSPRYVDAEAGCRFEVHDTAKIGYVRNARGGFVEPKTSKQASLDHVGVIAAHANNDPAKIIEWHQSKPLIWGVSDCCMAAGDFIMVKYGFDPMAAWRGVCLSESLALRAIAKAGGMAAGWGATMTQIAIADIGEGDIVIDHIAVGFVFDGQIHHKPMTGGMATFEANNTMQAFRAPVNNG